MKPFKLTRLGLIIGILGILAFPPRTLRRRPSHREQRPRRALRGRSGIPQRALHQIRIRDPHARRSETLHGLLRPNHLVESGGLGEIRTVRAAYLMAFFGRLSGWRSSKKLAGSGVLADIGSHLIYLVQRLAGEIQAVSALERGDAKRPRLRCRRLGRFSRGVQIGSVRHIRGLPLASECWMPSYPRAPRGAG